MAGFVTRLLVWLDRPGRAQRTWGRWPVVRVVIGYTIWWVLWRRAI